MQTATKGVSGPLRLMRFLDPMYALLDPITWRPSTESENPYPTVIAPRGFVTDLASIPPIFYSLLRPDGRYAYAAIIHDYLYWEQNTKREDADEIFRFAMVDLGVSPLQTATLYNAVRRFGESAWKSNANQKANGEKRILASFPNDPTVTWDVWKRTPDVFK
ncbi:DUF1353 domain-containing protein [Paraburkholderia aromaticivorans]|uniref:DUF1353 domain-containing protein n=1 Tax=Paraburkholderia aromaticivorans TaxID=2026199 RepID=UPI00197E0013|nr:DUF1353 domain-containing protein [Paraburkholderia aromaticivorans]